MPGVIFPASRDTGDPGSLATSHRPEQTRARNGFRILKEDETCWRIAYADRAAVLIDGAAYYGALRASLLKAHRSVFILGWDIDSRTRLVGSGDEHDDGLPEQLAPFLTELVGRRPELKIHILLWDYSMLFAFSREPLPQVKLAWKTPEQISVCLDDVLPVGASHHTKIVVIDEAVAFCGGLDLTIRRWDTPAHAMENAARTDPAGEPYRPFHDVQMMVDGEAAKALGELARGRWRDAACETPIRARPVCDPWPDHVQADLRNVPVGIARTLPPYEERPGVREVELLYSRAIGAAEKSIYVESQFLTADSVARDLARRLQECAELTAIIVGPNVHASWLEEHSMNSGRLRFMNVLKDAGVLDRVRLLYPALPDDPTDEGVMIHSKVMVVDDWFLRVGSANLNNRSMGMDTECDLAIEAVDDAHREGITAVRNRLLAEHLDVSTRSLESSIRKWGSLIAAVEALSDRGRSLRPIDLSRAWEDELTRAVGQIADPERPIETPAGGGDLFGGAVENTSLRRTVKLLLAAIALLGLALAWRYTPLRDFTDPAALVQRLEELRQGLWMPLFVPLMFMLGGLIVFPVTILIAVVGMMFSPMTAFIYAFYGSLVSAGVIFCIGRLIGRSPVRTLLGARSNRVSRALTNRGILSVAALRMLPIAPFSIVNLIAGAVHIRAVDFFIGTVVGMAPGILAISFLGHQFAKVLSDPTWTELVLLALGILAWLLLCMGLQYLAIKLRSPSR